MPRKKKNNGKWFPAEGKPLGWRKEEGQAKRRATALASRNGNYLKTARALQALANVNSGPKGDRETERKARADAIYFFMKHRQKRGK